LSGLSSPRGAGNANASSPRGAGSVAGELFRQGQGSRSPAGVGSGTGCEAAGILLQKLPRWPNAQAQLCPRDGLIDDKEDFVVDEQIIATAIA